MLDQVISQLQDILLDWFRYPWIVVVLLAALPIVEARLAIPMAIKFGYDGIVPFLLGFFGSTLLAPLLLLVLIPFIRWLAGTKIFRRLGETLYEKFASKSRSLDSGAADGKKMFWLALFVAVPLPLTGVWTGCAVASIIRLPYWKALVSVAGGNVVACTILAVLSSLFSETVINYIIAAIAVIAVVIVAALIIKALCRGKKGSSASSDAENADGSQQ